MLHDGQRFVDVQGIGQLALSVRINKTKKREILLRIYPQSQLEKDSSKEEKENEELTSKKKKYPLRVVRRGQSGALGQARPLYEPLVEVALREALPPRHLLQRIIA